MKTIKHCLKELLSAIYPYKCLCCGKILDYENCICDTCNSVLEKIDFDNICFNCGLEKHDCVCDFHIYRFNSLVCCFKNSGLAQKIYYSYKFGKKQFSSDLFVNALADAVYKCYSDINFDCICAVPQYNKYKYDHCGFLVKKLSKRLNIPIMTEQLRCVKIVKSQHRSTLKERINNVEGKYHCACNINCENILLIDDIKTTGATIDECTRALLFAGAKNVYCITILGTSFKK